MTKFKLLTVLCALLGAGQAWAQMTDVTSSYITNPSFELGTDGTPASTGKSYVAPYQWTSTNLPTSGTRNFSILSANETGDTSPSAFGTAITPSNGSYYYFARSSWTGSLTTSLTQTSLSSLPEGIYLLKIDYKIAKSNGDLKPNGFLTIEAKQGSTSLGLQNSATSASQNNTYFNTASWSDLTVPFKLTSAGNVDFIITFNFNPGNVNIPQEAIIIDNVRLLKADYPAEPVATNTADIYLYNEKDKQYASAGETWGTHAIIDNAGQPLTATLTNGIYSFASQEFGKYFNDLYMDNGTSTPRWLFLETEEGSGKYYMTTDGINYLTSDGAGKELINSTTPTDASIWTVVSKANRITAMASATIDNPVDATFLLADPNLGRNNTKYSDWKWTFPNGENRNNFGDNTNFVVECYHKQFTFKQTLAAGTVPAGVYSMTAQGFYRQDGSDNNHLPVFFLNDETQTFPIRGAAAEGNMTAASTSFKSGNYTIDPIYVRIEDTNAFEVGAKLETNENLWCIWDNFQLKYYGDRTVAEVRLAAFVDAYKTALAEAQAFTESSMFADAWTALQGVITANTLDLNDSGLSESDLTTATTNLNAAIAAANTAVAQKTTYDAAVTAIGSNTNVDLTSLLTNAGFESGNTTGWANDGSITANAQDNTSYDNKQGTWYAERWHVAGTIDINQTLTCLPAGIYQIEAYMYSDTNDAKLYLNSENVSVSTSAKYKVIAEITDKGSIKFGASCTLTTSTWICVDDFKLTYLGSINDLTYTLATGKMGTDKSAAQTTAETTFLAAKTFANYKALIAAIADAEISAANYAKLKAAIDKAQDVLDKNNFVTAAATTALSNEISTATSAWTDVTYTDAQATAEIATLGTAVSVWHAIASEGKAGAFMTSAWGKDSENWWDGYYINTWSTEGDTDGSGFSVPFFEYYTDGNKNLSAKTMTATLSGIPNGWYDVELWARVQRRSDADFNSDNTMITMSVNDGTAVSIMSNTSNNVGTGTSVMRLGQYTARGKVTDGTLTLSINVKLGANVHWLCWRDVKYTKVEEKSIDITSAGYATYVNATEDLDFSGVDNLKAYKATISGTTISFNKVTTVPAGEGVLLKGAAGNYNVPIATGVAAWDADDNAFVAGTGANVASQDGTTYNYVLSSKSGNVGFYPASGKAVEVGKAYLSTTVNAARLTMTFDDESETTAIREQIGAKSDAQDAVYNLQGQRVEKTGKGLYIRNGKKIFVK